MPILYLSFLKQKNIRSIQKYSVVTGATLFSLFFFGSGGYKTLDVAILPLHFYLLHFNLLILSFHFPISLFPLYKHPFVPPFYITISSICSFNRLTSSLEAPSLPNVL